MKEMAQGRDSGHGVSFVGVFPCIDSGFETPLCVFVHRSQAGLLVSATASFPGCVLSGWEGRS